MAPHILMKCMHHVEHQASRDNAASACASQIAWIRSTDMHCCIWCARAGGHGMHEEQCYCYEPTGMYEDLCKLRPFQLALPNN